MGAVLVHIDLDGERPHASSMAALAAGREVASSWGATLYAALVVHDASERGSPDSTAQVVTTRRVPGIDATQSALARAGADKVVVAISDTPVVPLWAAIGTAWQAVVDHLRPRLVLFGADAPSAPELGPRTGARLGARLLTRARARGGDHVELRDRDGDAVRASDGGVAVVLIGAANLTADGDDDIDLLVLASPGGVDARIEVVGAAPAEPAQHARGVVVLGDDVGGDAQIAAAAARLATVLDATLLGGAAAARTHAIPAGAVVDRLAALAPELCVAIGAPLGDVAGASRVVRIGEPDATADATLAGPPATSLEQLARILEDA